MGHIIITTLDRDKHVTRETKIDEDTTVRELAEIVQRMYLNEDQRPSSEEKQMLLVGHPTILSGMLVLPISAPIPYTGPNGYKYQKLGLSQFAKYKLKAGKMAEYYVDPYVIPIGCEVDELNPVFLDLRDRNRAVICGEHSGEVSAFARALIEMGYLSFLKMRIICIDGSDGEMEPIRDYCTDFFRLDEIEQAMVCLEDAIEENTSFGEKEELPQGRVLLLLHQVNHIVESREEMSLRSLHKLSRVKEKSTNFIVLATGLREELTKAVKDSLIVYHLLLWKDAIVVSGNPERYFQELDFCFAWEIKRQSLLPGYGVCCQADNTSAKIRLLQEE